MTMMKKRTRGLCMKEYGVLSEFSKTDEERTLSVHEVLSMLEEDGDLQGASVYIEPPDANGDTDEDSGDEDGEGTVSNLNGHQLAAPATATVFRNGQRQLVAVEPDDLNDQLSSSDEEPVADGSEASSTPRATCGKGKKAYQPPATRGVKRKKQGCVNARQWRHVDLSARQKSRFSWNKPSMDLSNVPSSPVELFEIFFDQDLLELIAEQSTRYAKSKGNMFFSTNPEEIKTFIGILLRSGYCTLPRRRIYWASDEDVHSDYIASAMSRNGFEEMMRYIHISDNDHLDAGDKFAKVRPLLSNLNEKFLAYFKILQTQNLSIDESMIPYYGRHSAKQFIRGKPIRFGYKMWVLTTPLGYVLQFEPYQGARGRQVQYPGVGMGGSVILDLIAELQLEEDCSYHLTFDNLFTSLKLVDCLTENNIGCTGTIRSNRIENCPLQYLKKSQRGTFDYATDTKSGLIVVRWNDNNIVNVVSNVVGVEPVQNGRRWSRAESRQISITQPAVIRHYNQTMGGVDRMDQNVNKYRVTLRSKKWWWPLLAYCIDLCVQQTWHLYRATDDAKAHSMDLLDIRRAITRVYIARACPANPGRPRSFNMPMDKRVSSDVRFDRIDHLVEPWETQLRCACCGLKTKHRCSKCKVGVHDRCFIPYHTK